MGSGGKPPTIRPAHSRTRRFFSLRPIVCPNSQNQTHEQKFSTKGTTTPPVLNLLSFVTLSPYNTTKNPVRFRLWHGCGQPAVKFFYDMVQVSEYLIELGFLALVPGQFQIQLHEVIGRPSFIAQLAALMAKPCRSRRGKVTEVTSRPITPVSRARNGDRRRSVTSVTPIDFIEEFSGVIGHSRRC